MHAWRWRCRNHRRNQLDLLSLSQLANHNRKGPLRLSHLCPQSDLTPEAIAKLEGAKNRPFGVPRHGGGSPTHSSMFSPPPYGLASCACQSWREAAKIIDFSHRWSLQLPLLKVAV